MKHFYLYTTLVLCLFFLQDSSLKAYNFEKFKEKYNENTEYTIWLLNGDIISGIIEFIDKDNEEVLQIQTLVGKLVIYEDEIQKIIPTKEIPATNNRTFIMPTANPISNNHYVGIYEILMPVAGFGITDWVSIMGGRTILPRTTSSDQISIINGKVSFPKFNFKDTTSIVLALGANFVWLNADNRLTHLFGIATYNTQKNSNVSFAVFYKIGNQEYPTIVHIVNENFTLNYPDGAFGISASAEVKFNGRKDLSFIGEFWNSNIMKPTNSAVLLGLRLAGRNFASDFGITVFTSPAVVPFANFIWKFN